MAKPTSLLMVEDDAAWRTACLLLCEELWPAAVIDEAATLAQGVALWREHPYDLVLSDLRLPDSLPEATMATWATVLPPLVPLVVISGSVARIEGYSVLRKGADAFLLKGADIRVIQDTLLQAWLAACGRRARAMAWGEVLA